MQAAASTWFGSYEVLRPLRVGGMATVYLARRRGAAGFSRLVVLKLVHPRLTAQPGYVEMFVDEARICAQISHPNVVHVEEFGVIDGIHYLAMEYLDGCSVGELLQLCWHEHRMLHPDLTARIIMQIAGGLHAAHETRGQDGKPLDVIHRDISPSNILLSLDGNAKVIDFGVAKARNRLFETQGVRIKGRYNYMAPEQAKGGSIDRRCDIFSLGVVFWELLVGWPLFPDDSFVALSNRLHRTEVLAPSVANPWAPPVFDLIVLDMLRHDPAARLPTAAEVQRRIAAAAPGAANHDASELGTLVRDVRARRVEQLATEGTEVASCPASFPRAARSRPSSTGHRVEVEPAPVPDARGPSAAEEPAPAPGERRPSAEQPTAPRRWTPHRALIVAAGLIVVGVAAGTVLGRPDERPEGSTLAPSHRNEIELVEVPLPAAASAPASAASPPPPETPGDAVRPPPPEPVLPSRAVASGVAVRARPPAPPASPVTRASGRAPTRTPRNPGAMRTGASAAGAPTAAPVPPAPPPPDETGSLTHKPFDDPDNDRSTADHPDTDAGR